MNDERWPRIKELFHQALDRTGDERLAFLASACAGDEGMRSEVQRLLVAHEEAGSFIDHPPHPSFAQTDAPVNSLSGRTIGHYEVGALVGIGGMGEVYLARDTELGRVVALKVMAADGIEAQEALRREARHASGLNHPHICTIHHVGSCDGRTYIVMEFVEGRPLSDLVGTLPLHTAVRFGVQIADALAHAHGRGVVHGDLKSANVVITPEERAKVLDFGLARRSPARQTDEDTETPKADAPLAGTVAYMAPELLRGHPPDPQSDLWAFGVMLHEIAIGRRPFAAGNRLELVSAILHDPVLVPGDDAVRPVRPIIERSLARDRQVRYRDAIELRSDLERLDLDRRNATVAAPPPRVRGWRRRATFAAALAGTLLVVWAARVERATPEPVSAASAGSRAVAVMPFTGAIDSPDARWLSTGVSSMLMTSLAQPRGVRIVSARRLQEALDALGGGPLASIERGQMADVARRAGASALVFGSVTKSGSDIRIDASLEDLDSGRVVVGAHAAGTELFALVDQVTGRILDGLGQERARVRGIAEVSSSSLEAYRLYSEGLEALNHTRFTDAADRFNKAVMVDPTFAAAYLRLAGAAMEIGQNGKVGEYLTSAASHADRLSEQERMLLDVRLGLASGSIADAAHKLDELIDAFPEMEDPYSPAYQIYGTQFSRLYDPQKALEISRKGVTALPASIANRTILAYALLETGRYGEAVHEFEEVARLAPREPNPHDSLGDAYLLQGDSERAIDSYGRAMVIDPTFEGSHNGRAWSLAVVGRFDEALRETPVFPQFKALLLSRVGRYREAAETIAAGIREAEARGSAGAAGALHLIAATIDIERQDYSTALRESRLAEQQFEALSEANRRIPRVVLEAVRSVAELRSGQVEAARSRRAGLAGAYEPSVPVERWWVEGLDGELALAAGDTDRAAVAFAAGQPAWRWFDVSFSVRMLILALTPFRDGPARLAVARGNDQQAVEIYRRLLSYGPESKWVAPLEPRFVLAMARLLERTGDTAAARRAYEQFLQLWSHADSGLPEVAEVRRAVTRLARAAQTGARWESTTAFCGLSGQRAAGYLPRSFSTGPSTPFGICSPAN